MRTESMNESPSNEQKIRRQRKTSVETGQSSRGKYAASQDQWCTPTQAEINRRKEEQLAGKGGACCTIS
jgi:hypothetical protein